MLSAGSQKQEVPQDYDSYLEREREALVKDGRAVKREQLIKGRATGKGIEEEE